MNHLSREAIPKIAIVGAVSFFAFVAFGLWIQVNYDALARQNDSSIRIAQQADAREKAARERARLAQVEAQSRAEQNACNQALAKLKNDEQVLFNQCVVMDCGWGQRVFDNNIGRRNDLTLSQMLHESPGRLTDRIVEVHGSFQNLSARCRRFMDFPVSLNGRTAPLKPTEWHERERPLTDAAYQNCWAKRVLVDSRRNADICY